jgi:hypothetical protein
VYVRSWLIRSPTGDTPDTAPAKLNWSTQRYHSLPFDLISSSKEPSAQRGRPTMQPLLLGCAALHLLALVFLIIGLSGPYQGWFWRADTYMNSYSFGTRGYCLVEVNGGNLPKGCYPYEGAPPPYLQGIDVAGPVLGFGGYVRRRCLCAADALFPDVQRLRSHSHLPSSDLYSIFGHSRYWRSGAQRCGDGTAAVVPLHRARRLHSRDLGNHVLRAIQQGGVRRYSVGVAYGMLSRWLIPVLTCQKVAYCWVLTMLASVLEGVAVVLSAVVVWKNRDNGEPDPGTPYYLQ